MAGRYRVRYRAGSSGRTRGLARAGLGCAVMAGCDCATRGVRVLEAGKGLAQRVQAYGAQAECLGVEVLEAEGGSGPRLGIFPGLEPDPLAELVGRGLPGPAEEAVELKAQPILFPAGVGPQELPCDL